MGGGKETFGSVAVIWEVVIGRGAERTLASLSKPLRKRLMAGIDRLSAGPYRCGADVKPRKGRSEWRLRVGEWCILFRVFDEKIQIVVVSLSPRGDAYK